MKGENENRASQDIYILAKYHVPLVFPSSHARRHRGLRASIRRRIRTIEPKEWEGGSPGSNEASRFAADSSADSNKKNQAKTRNPAILCKLTLH